MLNVLSGLSPMARNKVFLSADRLQEQYVPNADLKKRQKTNRVWRRARLETEIIWLFMRLAFFLLQHLLSCENNAIKKINILSLHSVLASINEVFSWNHSVY